MSLVRLRAGRSAVPAPAASAGRTPRADDFKITEIRPGPVRLSLFAIIIMV